MVILLGEAWRKMITGYRSKGMGRGGPPKKPKIQKIEMKHQNHLQNYHKTKKNTKRKRTNDLQPKRKVRRTK
jgi:hypothetical protein